MTPSGPTTTGVIDAHALTKTYGFGGHPLRALCRKALSPLRKKVQDTDQPHVHHALHDVSFRIERGESVGIIGRNGAGKSTLLQIIAGTLLPTKGFVDVWGRLAALLELGSGFNPEFTGQENVFLNAAILGLSREETQERYDDIVAFANIGDYIDEPCKTYSSGMLVRLAYAVNAMVDPEIMIVDEALSVGDIFFQQKCAKHLKKLRENGTTLLFVSHDTTLVRDLCERAILLHQGRIAFDGDSKTACALYWNSGQSKVPSAPSTPEPRTIPPAPIEEHAFTLWTHPEQTREKSQQILQIDLPGDNPLLKTRIGGDLQLNVLWEHRADEEAILFFYLQNRYSHLVTVQHHRYRPDPGAQTGERLRSKVCITLRCLVEAGEYTFRIHACRPNERRNAGTLVDETPWLGPLSVTWDYENEEAPFLGQFMVPMTFETLPSETLPSG